MSNAAANRPRCERRILGVAGGLVSLAAVLILSLSLNLFGNDFPIAYHIDEWKKVNFIEYWIQDFKHPLLLLQLVRLPNLLLGLAHPQEIVEFARGQVALIGMCLVLMIYVLTEREYPNWIALIVSFTVACCPIVVVHAHYVKEDILLTTCLVMAIWRFVVILDKPTYRNAIWLGIACGLAFSSHYKSILLIAVFASFLVLEYFSDGQRMGAGHHFRWLGHALLGITFCVLTFLTVNYPLLIDWEKFIRGVSYEANHARDGHAGVRIDPWDQWFTYHLRRSLLPGMTLPILLWGLAGFTRILTTWRRLPATPRLLFLFSLIFYVVPEISPTKPPPGDCRYVLPVAVGLLGCGAELLRWISFSSTFRQCCVFGLLIAATAYSLADSVLLDWYMNKDTRGVARAWVERHLPNANVYFGRQAHCGQGQEQRLLDFDDLRERGFDYVVVSSFHYDRYLEAAKWEGQGSDVYQQADQFERLFSLPYHEVQPNYRTFAFTNPILRVVSLYNNAPAIPERK